MFADKIISTPFTTDEANSYFNIHHSNSMDASFPSTLRALAAPRTKGESFVHSVRHIQAASLNDIWRVMSEVTYRLEVITCTSLVLERLKNAPALPLGYVRVKKVTDFFAKYFEVVCFTNADRKATFVMLNDRLLKAYHYLQTAIPVMLPWYFPPEEGLSELEMELIKSLKEKTPDKYMACLEKIAVQYDFRESFIRKQLDGIELEYEKRQIDALKIRIRDKKEVIEEYNLKIRECLISIRKDTATLMGLELGLSQKEGNSEILDYFICNKSVELIGVLESRLTFVVTGTLTYFDTDMLESLIRNPDSYLFHYANENMPDLLRAIFIEEALKLRVCAGFYIDFAERAGGLNGYDFPDRFSSYLPNPHVNDYECLGTAREVINLALQNHDFISVIEQCIVAATNLNFGDSTVIKSFMKTMYGQSDKSNRTFIELPDGSTVTPAEALAWIGQRNGIEAMVSNADSQESGGEEYDLPF